MPNPREMLPQKLSDTQEEMLVAAALYTHPADPDAVRKSLSAENQRIVPVEPLLAPPHPMDAVPVRRELHLPSLQGAGEAVEVVATVEAYGSGWAGVHWGKTIGETDNAERQLMTVAQHQRIMAASVADPGAVAVSRELLEQIAVELEHDNDRYFLGRELRALLANSEGVKK